MEKNRAIKRMEQINDTVDWTRIESLPMRNYPVGKSFEGNDAYPPLILMKCLLLQQWFKIDSDPELEPKSTTESPSKSFWGFLLTIPLPIIPPSPGSEVDSLKTLCV
jgi:IS5 family transposase